MSNDQGGTTSTEHPDVPVEGYDPNNSGVPGTGETAADMFLDLLEKHAPERLEQFRNGDSKIIVINS